jgi:DNA-binding MarR family transcriptional regulator
VLYELAHGGARTASDIARALDLDAGYLSRTLKGFERRGLIRRRQSTTDRRRLLLEVTERGRRVFNDLNRRAIEDVERLVSHLSVADRRRLVRAMTAVRRLLGDPASPVRPGRRSS